MTFLFDMMKLGLGNLARHKLRSLLTALGIIFGVAAVITMVSIGEGSKQQALARIERLGARNIIIRSQRPPESLQMGGGQQTGRLISYGLTRADLAALKANFPDAQAIVPLKEVGSQILKDNKRQVSQAFGTTPDYQSVANLRVARGRYLSQPDVDSAEMVAVIGSEVARILFPFDDPIGDTIRIDSKAFKIIGVLAPVGFAGGSGGAQVGRSLDLDLHIPISTASIAFGDTLFRRTGGSFQASDVELSEIYLATTTRDEVLLYADLAKRVLEVKHPDLIDINVFVPYQLLESARRDAQAWQLVLSTIAGISLLVGGIGIMNIMLASVTERTREIGIRRALGATRRHITSQFLIETGVLSFVGGIIGVAAGVALSLLLGWSGPRLAQYFNAKFELATLITPWSILLAFSVAALTGLVFGLYPAVKASRQDPIVALRHD